MLLKKTEDQADLFYTFPFGFADIQAFQRSFRATQIHAVAAENVSSQKTSRTYTLMFWILAGCNPNAYLLPALLCTGMHRSVCLSRGAGLSAEPLHFPRGSAGEMWPLMESIWQRAPVANTPGKGDPDVWGPSLCVSPFHFTACGQQQTQELQVQD